MQRISIQPRSDWQPKVESVGLTYHSPEAMSPRTYWDESACYRFTAAEVDTLEAAANDLQTMCLAAAQFVIDHKRYEDLGIPWAAIPMIEWAWNQEPPAIYGRFDIAWAGAGFAPPKLLEYNADTPTSLLEAAVVQWHWLKDVGQSIAPNPDQFNSLHERLIAKWKDVADYLTQPLYFAGLDEPEDVLTVAYLQDTANQAGIETRRIAMRDIGWNPDRQAFVDIDRDESQIASIFKLYPWEAMLHEEFGPHALETYQTMSWIEPIWKLVLSNKGILPILWELYPNHPLLLEAHFERPDAPNRLANYVRKPLFSREGANVTLVQPGQTPIQTDGIYGDGKFIVQALAPACVFKDTASHEPRYPVLGLWMIDQECGGMGIRESVGPITDNLSSFVPHLFD